MKKLLTFCAAGILIAPSLWIAGFILNHLRRLNTPGEPYSFGINLQFGVGEIRDPWSDILILLCCTIAVVCGIAIGLVPEKRKILLAVGVLALALNALAVFILMV